MSSDLSSDMSDKNSQSPPGPQHAATTNRLHQSSAHNIRPLRTGPCALSAHSLSTKLAHTLRCLLRPLPFSVLWLMRTTGGAAHAPSAVSDLSDPMLSCAPSLMPRSSCHAHRARPSRAASPDGTGIRGHMPPRATQGGGGGRRRGTHRAQRPLGRRPAL